MKYMRYLKNHSRLIAGFVLAAFAGGFLGFAVQAGETAAWNCRGGLLSAFGSVSFGLFFWIVLGTVVSLHSRCGLHASLLMLCMLTPVLFGYCVFSHMTGGFLNHSLLYFGALMLLPAAAAAWVLRASNDRRSMQIFLCAAGVLAIAFDLGNRASASRTSLLLMLLLSAVYFRTVFRMPVSPRRTRRSRNRYAVYAAGRG
ncbi:MAG: hypothetical protein IKQ39_07570 [Oscillospiraceae bacterium]|nr:hypothetical protein [Oscillospiraceae bacterium]